MAARVVILQRRLPAYRVAFFERLRAALRTRGVDVALVHGTPAQDEATRRDDAALDWATRVTTRYVPVGARRVAYHPVPRAALCGAELVVAPHELSYAPAYPLLARAALGRLRLALWGHGTAPGGRSPGAWLRRLTTRAPHWWFAYTALSVDRVVAAGFPRERITCVDNAVDTAETVALARSTPAARVDALRRELNVAGDDVGLFLGSVTRERRLDLLVDACDALRTRLPRFQLLVVGDGPMMPFLRAAAGRRPWMRLAGARHGTDKAACCALARVMLNPGMVGLNVVDAFALGVPMVTTDQPGHSPEIAYLVPGENGLRTEPRADAFARAVESVLRDDAVRARLRVGCERAAARYTIDNMAARFAGGVVAALAAAWRRRA